MVATLEAFSAARSPHRVMATTTTDNRHYPWEAPEALAQARLQVLNSLTGTKVPFVASDGGNRITWYICGPTVYDSAHVGHASNFVRFDIVRRILSDFFGFDVVVQMNVTDVDDKIIRRANERGISFEALSREFEDEFMEDMDALNVRRPDFVTRVSEYVPEIIEYIQTIIANGFAYESEGSVYFDTGAFTDGGHNYGKLEPWSVGNEGLIAEGEGAITGADDTLKRQKRSPNDFVLWKKSKQDEPSWESAWGPGRPGWHIECSAMASKVLGPVIDIHAGGVDLRFPHHSNEIAQAEAYHKTDQWVNYFLHAGHLDIEGLKMSKSLKNFITIRKCLERYNARQMRLSFLGHRYDARMTYSEHAMDESISLDRTFIDFFGNLKAVLRDVSQRESSQVRKRPGDVETELARELRHHQEAVHKSLADNFDTPSAMSELLRLVRSTNAYIAATGSNSNVPLLESIGRYLTKMFRVLGLTSGNTDEIGYGDAGGSSGVSREAVVGPILDTFSNYRDAVRRAARAGKEADIGKEILRLSDQVRDDVLPPLGVRLEDRGADQSSLWKLEDSATLMLEIQRKKDEEEVRRLEKELQKKLRLEKELAELEKGRLPPEQMFRKGEDYANKYSAFDEQGMPTADVNGVAITKSALKALTKARARQEKLHKKFLDAVSDGRLA